MKVYITGARGMVGANLNEQLNLLEDYQVLSPGRDEVDLLDLLSISHYLTKHQPDFIVHSAGLVGGIQANMANLYGYLIDNTMMGLNLIKAAKEAGVKNLINLSSSCVYPKDAPNPLKEEMFLTGALEPTNEGYALAKNTVMRACEYLSKQEPEYNYKTIVPVNLYGKHDKYGEHNSHMIPAVIKKIDQAIDNNNQTVEIWGTGKVRREFLYAGDLADFIIYSMKYFDDMPEVVNCSHGVDYTINEFYEMIAEVLGYQGGFEHNDSYPDGIDKKLTDISKMRAFGWIPPTEFKQGVELAYQDYIGRVKNNYIL